jgi:putative tricarboxylic transport membrane protein
MRLSDRVSGLLAFVVGVAVVLYTRTFPELSGQDIGPALFPSLAGAGLAGFGLWLIVADFASGPRPLVHFDEWTGRPQMVINFGLVVVALVGYILLAEPLGFFVTGILLLSVLMLAFGARRRWILPVAVVTAFAMHYAFYTLLRVALPWGIFRAVAW